MRGSVIKARVEVAVNHRRWADAWEGKRKFGVGTPGFDQEGRRAGEDRATWTTGHGPVSTRPRKVPSGSSWPTRWFARPGFDDHRPSTLG